MVLDLYDLCEEKLKATLKAHRDILAQREEVRLQNRHSSKKDKVGFISPLRYYTVSQILTPCMYQNERKRKVRRPQSLKTWT